MRKIYSVGPNERSDFYELRQQYKQLREMEMKKVWFDAYGNGYTHKDI